MKERYSAEEEKRRIPGLYSFRSVNSVPKKLNRLRQRKSLSFRTTKLAFFFVYFQQTTTKKWMLHILLAVKIHHIETLERTILRNDENAVAHH